MPGGKVLSLPGLKDEVSRTKELMTKEIMIKQDSQMSLQPANMGELIQVSDMLSSTEFVPLNFQGKPNDIVAAIMMGNEVNLSPMQALKNIAVINGRPSLWGDVMMAIVRASDVFGGINETFDENTMTAHCYIWRKGEEKVHQAFSKEDATVAGLWGKKGPWTTYPKRMLTMRARGFALRDTFADLLAGMITREEAYDTPPEVETKQVEAEIITISEQISEAQTLNDLIDIYNVLSDDDKVKYKEELSTRKEELISSE